MVTETDRNKARSAVVSAYHALDCVTIPFSFLHAFADAAVDAVSTDAEPVAFEHQNYNCPCIHPSQCDETCVKTAPAVALTRLAIRTGGSGANVYAFTEADDDGDYVFYTEAKSALAAQVPDVAETLEAYYQRQIEWSRETFGPALRTKGIIDHIKKELREIEADPRDLSEWVDVVILAMDGFWRHGGNAEDLFKSLIAKQQKNMARTWPDWRTMSEDSAIEHDRSKDASSPASKHGDAE